MNEINSWYRLCISGLFRWEKDSYPRKGESTMDAKELKKILAGIGVVGLLAGGGVSVPGSAGASG